MTTLWILPLACLVRNLPVAGRVAVPAGARQHDPAFAAGASLAFVTAFGDFVTSIMPYTYDIRPISLEIRSSPRQADVGTAAADGVGLMLVSAAVRFLAGETRGGTG